jgi:hypothetical protein
MLILFDCGDIRRKRVDLTYFECILVLTIDLSLTQVILFLASARTRRSRLHPLPSDVSIALGRLIS